MSRAEGFDVMDVSTALPNDPKVKRLAREFPAQLGPGFLVYVSTMAESWKAGERVTYDDAWPGYLPYDQATVDALHAVKLLDPKGRVTLSAWRGFFEQARDRREKSRERWRRANDKRSAEHAAASRPSNGETTPLPRGRNAGTAANPSDSDSVRTDSDSVGVVVGESHHPREAELPFGPARTTTTSDERNGREKSRPTRVGEVLGAIAPRSGR